MARTVPAVPVYVQLYRPCTSTCVKEREGLHHAQAVILQLCETQQTVNTPFENEPLGMAMGGCVIYTYIYIFTQTGTQEETTNDTVDERGL